MKLKSTKLLFLYRSFLFRFVKFETDNEKLENIVKALNIKNRKQRIEFIYAEMIKSISNYYKEDLCQFKNNQCIAQRKNKSNYTTGCCRLCLYKTGGDCLVNNVACKMFYCNAALKNFKELKYNDLELFKVLSITNQFMLKSDYFTKEEDVIKDLNYGILIGTLRVTYRFIKQFIYYKKI